MFTTTTRNGSASQRVRDILPDEAEELLQRRFGIIQVWRPIRYPVETYPLAMADAQTLSPQDMIVSERRAPGRIGQTYAIKYNPEHKWYGSRACGARRPMYSRYLIL